MTDLNFLKDPTLTLIENYSDSTNKDKELIHILRDIAERQSRIENLLEIQKQKTNTIYTFLEENRGKYLNSLNIVVNKEDEVHELIQETKKILNANRGLYGQSFDSILQGERQLRDLLQETKTILEENRTSYTLALKNLTEKLI